MRSEGSPHARLYRAIERGSMAQVREAAVEAGHMELDVTLRIVLAIAAAEPHNFDKAATRWLGRLLCAHPTLGLERAAEVADELDGLFGHSPEVARSRIALALRSVGEVRAASVLERSSRENDGKTDHG